jgi:hypothetical protein
MDSVGLGPLASAPDGCCRACKARKQVSSFVGAVEPIGGPLLENNEEELLKLV